MNYIFFDTETDSGRSTANILQINALFCSSDFKIIEELNCEAKLRKSRIYEVDSFLVNNLDPFAVDKHPLSSFELTKKVNDTFISWINKGPVLFCAHNGYSFDYMLTSQHLFSNLFTWPWIFSTGNAKQIDSLPIAQNYNFYAPNTIATELNEKNNQIFRLGSLAKMNGFEITELHTARGDTMGMKLLMEMLYKKNPELFQKSISFTNKNDVLSKIKDVDYFCHPETFFGRTRQFTSSYLCEHPIYRGYHLCFDLKHDPELMFSEKSNSVLKKTLNGAPKKYRTLKIGKNPFIQDKSFATNYEDDYATLGHEILKTRADFITKNREELANRVSTIISDDFQDKQNMDQTELIPEQMIFSLNPTASDKTLMNNYVIANSMDDKLRIHKGFKGPLKHLSEMILLDQYDKDAFSDADYNRIRKGISRRLLSTNKEVFPTIPDGMARIDQLREEKKDDKETLEKVENINKHLELLTEDHEKYL